MISILEWQVDSTVNIYNAQRLDLYTNLQSHGIASFCVVTVLLWMTIFVPGGATGTLLKSWFPLSIAHLESLGFIREVLNKLRVSSHCGRRRSHSWMGYWLSHVGARPLSRWFFKVLIAFLAAFLLCWCGGTNSYFALFRMMANFKSVEHSLSKTFNFGVVRFFANLA